MDKELKNYMDSLISILYETNLTATEIAKRSGLSTSQISRILSGKCLPRFSSLCKIFSSLNIDIRLFFKNPNWSYSELLNDKISLMTDDEIKKLRCLLSQNIRLIQYNKKRLNPHFTQSHLSKLIGGDGSTKSLERILRGKHDLSFEKLIDISIALNVNPAKLLTDTRSDYNMMDIKTFIKKLEEIKAKGYIRTLRRGDTGVGHTLEQELGLTENNISLPDLGVAELKAARRNTSSMLTLFTKEPLSDKGRKRDRYLLETFAYDSDKEDRIKELYTTISALDYNAQGFKLEVTNKEIRLIHKDIPLDVYWTAELLQKTFEDKLPALVYVYADHIGEDADEHFHYTEARLLKGFDFKGFMKAVQDGYIKVDLRMHMKNNGRPRNHGTAFRILRSHLPICFKEQQILVKP